MNGNRRSPEEIADVLRERIRVGALRAGDRLPTQAELVDEFGVERGMVRQALRILQSQDLLTNVTKGSPPRVAEVRPEPHQSRAARVVLKTYLAEAFGSSAVRIDAICFTAETLMWALGEMCTAVARGEVHPDSVEVRCLLPGRDVPLPYPDPVDRDRPKIREKVHKRLKEQIEQQQEVMRTYLSTLTRDHGIDTKVTFRSLTFVPSMKQYVLNGTLALQGNYQPARRSYQDLPGEDPFEVIDVSGFKSALFEFRRDRGGQDAEIVEDTKNCFDALWESNAPRPTLS